MRVPLGAALDLDLDGEAAGGARGRHSGGDGAARPDVVILEHGHGAKVVAVRVAAADEHTVFLHEPEPRGGFAGAG